MELSYGQKGRKLFSFTDPNGAMTKYQYDRQGCITACYSADAKRKV